MFVEFSRCRNCNGNGEGGTIEDYSTMPPKIIHLACTVCEGDGCGYLVDVYNPNTEIKLSTKPICKQFIPKRKYELREDKALWHFGWSQKKVVFYPL